MANVITAGNSSNGGTAITTDTSGTLNIVTGSGSGTNAITIDTSQNVVFSGNVSGVLKSGTAVASTSGTSIDFTGIPSTAKRITVMFSGVSTNGSSNPLIQLGATSIITTGYLVQSFNNTSGGSTAPTSFTTGFGSQSGAAVNTLTGHLIITNLSGNIWVGQGAFYITSTASSYIAGGVTLSGTLDRVRITTLNGTDTFDAGTVNILWE